jgi:hypothetical protein
MLTRSSDCSRLKQGAKAPAELFGGPRIITPRLNCEWLTRPNYVNNVARVKFVKAKSQHFDEPFRSLWRLNRRGHGKGCPITGKS